MKKGPGSCLGREKGPGRVQRAGKAGNCLSLGRKTPAAVSEGGRKCGIPGNDETGGNHLEEKCGKSLMLWRNKRGGGGGGGRRAGRWEPPALLSLDPGSSLRARECWDGGGAGMELSLHTPSALTKPIHPNSLSRGKAQKSPNFPIQTLLHPQAPGMSLLCPTPSLLNREPSNLFHPDLCPCVPSDSLPPHHFSA